MLRETAVWTKLPQTSVEKWAWLTVPPLYWNGSSGDPSMTWPIVLIISMRHYDCRLSFSLPTKKGERKRGREREEETERARDLKDISQLSEPIEKWTNKWLEDLAMPVWWCEGANWGFGCCFEGLTTTMRFMLEKFSFLDPHWVFADGLMYLIASGKGW